MNLTITNLSLLLFLFCFCFVFVYMCVLLHEFKEEHRHINRGDKMHTLIWADQLASLHLWNRETDAQFVVQHDDSAGMGFVADGLQMPQVPLQMSHPTTSEPPSTQRAGHFFLFYFQFLSRQCITSSSSRQYISVLAFLAGEPWPTTHAITQCHLALQSLSSGPTCTKRIFQYNCRDHEVYYPQLIILPTRCAQLEKTRRDSRS